MWHVTRNHPCGDLWQAVGPDAFCEEQVAAADSDDRELFTDRRKKSISDLAEILDEEAMLGGVRASLVGQRKKTIFVIVRCFFDSCM